MASRPSHCRWSTKSYVLAALAGTLVVSVVVIAVSIKLSPAEVYFTVTNATMNSSANTSLKFLSLVLTANNTSHRAGVKYCSVIVYLRYKADVPKTIALKEVSPPSWQPPWSTASINVSAPLPHDLLTSDFAGRGSNATLVGVLLDTVVKFKYGRVYTRPYNIRVLCDPADYFSRWIRRSLPISCRDD